MATKTKKPALAKTINNQKIPELAPHTEYRSNEFMTTNQGVKVNDHQNSLKAGKRGGTLTTHHSN